ncbi:hypothetical protein GCM10010430_70310 [Kitasatospora cystarginea]|uniref:Uncharacterized protein n=1 Tax=Kitasatospora cystarginea TaxID=58350 RepID=A0ABP5RT07_9ACTN
MWQQHYVVFPRLLFVLADTGEQAAQHRIRDLQALAGLHSMVEQMLTTVRAGAARLDDLEQDGPGGAVWHTLTAPGGHGAGPGSCRAQRAVQGGRHQGVRPGHQGIGPARASADPVARTIPCLTSPSAGFSGPPPEPGVALGSP